MPKVCLQSAVQASQSNWVGQNMSWTPSMFMGIAWSPQARMFHPLMSSSAVWSSQISLHFFCPYEQQYSIDSLIALKISRSSDLVVVFANGMHEELAGQEVRFFRNDVGQGQFSIAKYEYASMMQSITSSMSLQDLRGLHRLKQDEMREIGAVVDPEYSISRLSPSRITLGQFALCMAKFLVTI